MKFTNLSLFILLFFTVPGFTQIQLAPIAGLNISKHRISQKLTEMPRPTNTHGFMSGLNTKYGITDHFNIQLEGAYSQKGYEYQIPNQPARTSLRLNYIDFSALMEYSINGSFSINGGASYGIKVGDKVNNADLVLTDFYNGRDIGLVVGLKTSINKFFIRTTYQHGVNPLERVTITDENGMTTGQTNAYNQTFQVAMGYYIF